MEKNIPRASIHVGEDKKSFSVQVSNEAERRGWDEERYQRKNAEEGKNNHYNFTRKNLNFEIMKGGKIMSLGTNPITLHERLQLRYDELHFKPFMESKHHGQVAENSPNSLVNIIFGGDHEVMKRLAFGDQELDTSDPNADQSNIVLMPDIYEWALDTYRFACRKWGEENILGFCVHCDETGVHAHVLTVPVEQVKKRGRIGSAYVNKDNPKMVLTTKEWKALPKEERDNYTKETATKAMVERVSYAKVWGETRQEKSAYLSQLHTDYHDEVGYKYGLERGIPYDELSDEEKRGRKHKDKITLEAERQAKVAIAEAKQQKEALESESMELSFENSNMKMENKELIDQKAQVAEELSAVNEQLQSANEELASTNAQKEEARRDLRSAQNGFMAKIFSPGKHKKEEEEKHDTAVEEGKRSVMDAIIKATNLIFSKKPTPDELGWNFRTLWDSKKTLEQQVKENEATIAEKDKVIAARNKTINDLNVKVTSLTTEVSGLRYKITLIDENAVSSLRQQLSSETQRANTAEENYNALLSRWNCLWGNSKVRELWEQIQIRKEEEKRKAEAESLRQKDRYNDILDRLIRDASIKLHAFAKTQRINFSDEEDESLYFGVIARCLKLELDPTKNNNRARALDEIFSSISWKGFSITRYECCKSWSNLSAFRMDVDNNLVDTFKATIANMCLSDRYVSLMGSNGAAHTLTHWDGTQVLGLGAIKKKQGGRSVGG